ncbi:MAG: V-type ATP synthase subunit D [Candidatus Aenigmatarchaeota archaeon]|nr:MAG: V-type ATP synthase subunit D [Candidatus Aenigmarchaeota archaeon]
MDIKATRSELLNLKRKIKLAEAGHKLLKKKRDGLIMEFFEVLKKAKNLRRELNEKYIRGHEKMLGSTALDGIVNIKSVAFALRERPAVDLEVKNIMGVTVPAIKVGSVRKTLFERGYGMLTTSMRINDVVNAYEDLLEHIITAAEIETTMRKLLKEIESTKRRVNALEFVVIPRLKEQASFINFRLEEMERENIFLMKKIKGE